MQSFQPTTCLYLQGSKGFQITEMFETILFAYKAEQLLFNAQQIIPKKGFRASEKIQMAEFRLPTV